MLKGQIDPSDPKTIEEGGETREIAKGIEGKKDEQRTIETKKTH